MNKLLMMMLTVGVSLVMVSAALAAPGNIAYTVHNMSSTNPGGLSRFIASNTETQICIFCHTPHNGRPAVPLWNKIMPSQSFNMYTSSSSLSPAAKAVAAPGPESLLCLSCHDGRTAINVLHHSQSTTNTATGSNGLEYIVDIGGSYSDATTPANTAEGLSSGVGMTIGMFGFANYGPNIGKLNDGSDINDSTYGGNLMDDHPISFSYVDAHGSKPTQLNDISVVKAKSSNAIRFFGNNNRLECSSCHDPHVPYGMDRMGNLTGVGLTELRPFLVMGNTGSALCLACHNK